MSPQGSVPLTTLSPQFVVPPKVVDYYGNGLINGSQLTTSFRGAAETDLCSTWPRNVRGPQECPEGVKKQNQVSSSQHNSSMDAKMSTKTQQSCIQTQIINCRLYQSRSPLNTMPKLYRQHSLENEQPYQSQPIQLISSPSNNGMQTLSRQYSLNSVIQEGIVYTHQYHQTRSPAEESQCNPGLVPKHSPGSGGNQLAHRSIPRDVPIDFVRCSSDDSSRTTVLSSSTNTLSSIGTVPGLILQPPSLSSYTSDSEQGSEQTSSFCST